MASNDQVILDQILRQKRQGIADSMSESEYFEFFTAEQILKDFDLSYDELALGIVGGGNDGGIDSLYCFVNGELVIEDTDLSVFKKDITIDLVIIQSKRSPGFSEAALDKLYSTTGDLLDLSKLIQDLSVTYNSQLLDVVTRFRGVYESLASKFPNLRIGYHYATLGLTINPKVELKAGAIKNLVGKLFSASETSFEFVGASRLLELARRKPTTTFTLNLAESPISASGAVGFMCLVRLKDYYNFITDENGNLLRMIFEANVRDYQGDIQVNAGIQGSLRGDRMEDFWWLNNGITIVASQATQSGKAITIENPNIVNGLQTSTEIYKYYKDSNTDDDERNVQVKIVVPEFVQSRDRIIKATNSQTNIPGASLRATEKIHRDIEEYLNPYQIYYDRRKNFYRNEGKPIDKIISIGQLSQAVMSILLGRPNDARARPSSLLKEESDYEAVFSLNYPIDIYRVCSLILKSVEKFIKSETAELERRDRNNIKFHLAMHLALTMAGKTKLQPKDVVCIDVDKIDDVLLNKSLQEVVGEYRRLGGTDQVAKGIDFPKAIISNMAS